MLVYRRHGPLPAHDLKNKSSGGKELGQTRLSLKRSGARHTPANDAGNTGYDPGIYGTDKDGVDWAFGKLTETAVNDFQKKNRDQ